MNKRTKFTEQLGALLLDARTKAGLTQEEVAKKVGIPRITYTHYELGDSSISMERFIKVCRVLGIDYSEALGSIDIGD